ncbi:heme-binding protein [Jatrophihabitans telluris]|uniref:Heme-binding protein n=1 Tax=Jatrophihabitans telluris TaxID=2038343 RepID=A0ABY4QVX4_9ACTN|nr:heme-binding protein [Jatrophihabitans telluris]UQX87407.1 heme-binding protein [Jatrophihabitans telluris]
MTHPHDVPLERARALVQRAVDKAEQLGIRGAIAVVGSSGALVTASRLDHGGPGGMGRATSKAWISGTQQIPSTEHLHRMTSLPVPISAGFVGVSPQAIFPGAGGIPILDEAGVVVGGIAASGATVSPFFPTGVAPEVVSADGEPANPEDLLIAYALGVPYVGQHGDDRARWEQRFGELTVAADRSLGMQPAPAATRQAELAWAREICDRVLALALDRGVRVSVAVVDRGADPVQQDRMDDAVGGGVEVAVATAATAARYGMSSHQVPAAYAAATGALGRLHPAPFLPVAGGVPLIADGRVVGGLGVGGADPQLCGELAAAALVEA